jgi:cellulose biosynthesis protein BcsE
MNALSPIDDISLGWHGVRMLADSPDASDGLVPGGTYALLAETPPARLPLMAGVLQTAEAARVPVTLLLPTQSPAVFMERVRVAGYSQISDALETGQLAIYQFQADFSKKMFRYGAESFARELEYYEVPPNSLLLVDQADDLLSLHDTALAIRQIQTISAWAAQRMMPVLLVFTRAAGSSISMESVNGLMDNLAGLARVGVDREGITLSFEFWQGPFGTVAARSVPLDVADSGLYQVRAQAGGASAYAMGSRLAPETAFHQLDSAYVRQDGISGLNLNADGDSEEYYALRMDTHNLQEALPGVWRRCNSLLELIRTAVASSSPTVFLAFHKDTDVRQLAEAVHTLRVSLPRRARIVVVEDQASLRYTNELLSLRLGANLIIHRNVPPARVPLLLETVKGQVYQPDESISFDEVVASVTSPTAKGWLPYASFIREARSLNHRSEALHVPNSLLIGQLRQDLTLDEVGAGIRISRMGDIVTRVNGTLALFLNGCPRASQPAAFKAIFQDTPDRVLSLWQVYVEPATIEAQIADLGQRASGLADDEIALPQVIDVTEGSDRGEAEQATDFDALWPMSKEPAESERKTGRTELLARTVEPASLLGRGEVVLSPDTPAPGLRDLAPPESTFDLSLHSRLDPVVLPVAVPQPQPQALAAVEPVATVEPVVVVREAVVEPVVLGATLMPEPDLPLEEPLAPQAIVEVVEAQAFSVVSTRADTPLADVEVQASEASNGPSAMAQVDAMPAFLRATGTPAVASNEVAPTVAPTAAVDEAPVAPAAIAAPAPAAAAPSKPSSTPREVSPTVAPAPVGMPEAAPGRVDPMPQPAPSKAAPMAEKSPEPASVPVEIRTAERPDPVVALDAASSGTRLFRRRTVIESSIEDIVPRRETAYDSSAAPAGLDETVANDSEVSAGTLPKAKLAWRRPASRLS